MDRLTPELIEEREVVLKRLKEAEDELIEAIDKANEAIEEANAKVDAYNEAIVLANEWRVEIESEIAEYVAKRSDKWRAGAQGETYEEWREAYEEELEEVDTFETLEHPTARSEDVTSLPDRPEGIQ